VQNGWQKVFEGSLDVDGGEKPLPCPNNDIQPNERTISHTHNDRRHQKRSAAATVTRSQPPHLQQQTTATTDTDEHTNNERAITK